MMDDCIIVGAGVIGLSLAYELAGRGCAVQLMDRQQPGLEASWAGAGIVPPGLPHNDLPALRELGRCSSRLHAHWASQLREETGIDTGYCRCGGIYLAENSDGRLDLEKQYAGWRDHDLLAEWLDAASLANLESELIPTLPDAAYVVPHECQLRTPRHLKALVAACATRGVRFSWGDAAESLIFRGNRVVGIRTHRETIEGGQICVTSGCWTRALLEPANVSLPVHPVRGQIVLLAPTGVRLRHIINLGSRYLVPRLDGRVLIGSTEEDAGYDCRITAGGVAGLLEMALSLVPALQHATIEKSWAGLRPATPDRRPHLGPVGRFENLFVAAGHFRSGLHLSTGTAVAMGQLMCGEQPDVDLGPFHPDTIT